MILEAGRSHDLPSASQRLRKAGDVIQSESTGLRTKGAESVDSSLGLRALESGVLRAGEDQYPSSNSQVEGTDSSFLGLFLLFRPSMDDAH